MTFSNPSPGIAQAQFASGPKDPSVAFVHSREAGDVLPGKEINQAALIRNESPVSKPWAHFVAGGYVVTYQWRRQDLIHYTDDLSGLVA